MSRCALLDCCTWLTGRQAQKDLPAQLLASKSPLEASLILGSFGSTAGSITPVLDITLKLDPNGHTASYEAPFRYGPLPEIHHKFRDDPKSPPKIVSLVFSLAVVATVPVLLIGVRFVFAVLVHLAQAEDRQQ